MHYRAQNAGAARSLRTTCRRAPAGDLDCKGIGAGVAKVACTFSMRETPEAAKQRFADELGPVLHRLGGFVRARTRSGYLLYSDGIRDPMEYGYRDGIA